MATPTITYLNENDIDFFYTIYNIQDHIKTISSLTIEGSLIGPKVSQTFRKDEKEFTPINKLFGIWDYLKKHELLEVKRPETTEESENLETDFFYENIEMHKLYFPKSKLTEIHGLDQLTIWISDPDFSQLSDEKWVFKGTFLILIESLYDRGNFRTTISGCSALQVLSNIITGSSFYTRDWDEPLGRNNLKHPIEKLKDIGAVYVHKQKISTIYRKRYMTNEQCFIYKDRKYRCNDLLAYPLFILS